MALTRPDLDRVPPYVPGGAERPGVDHGASVMLASNEVPFGPLPGVVAAIERAAAMAHRYPDMGAMALRTALAHRHGLDPAQIVTGCGSVALFEHVLKAAMAPTEQVVHTWRCFDGYPPVIAGLGVEAVRVATTAEHRHDLFAMAAAVTERTRVIVVCNPDNPTGTIVGRSELESLLDALPRDVLVVVDEAYREFVTDPAVPDALDLVQTRPGVVVLRSFSKAWGLAGLRVGWLAAAAPVADAVRKVSIPFSTSSLAQAAALAALEQRDEMLLRVKLIVTERERLINCLRTWLPTIPASQGNFFWLPLGARAAPFTEACRRRGILVRGYAGAGVRVTVGTDAQNDIFLRAAIELLADDAEGSRQPREQSFR